MSEAVRNHLPDLDSVRRSFGRTIFEQGLALWRGGRVDAWAVRDNALEGSVRDDTVHKSAWHFDEGGFLLECTCRRYAYCAHQVAIYLALRDHLETAGLDPGESSQASPKGPLDTPPGTDLGPRRRAAEPSLQLTLDSNHLRLHAELRSVAGDCVWPVDGATTVQATSSGVFSCDPELMKDASQSITAAGFRRQGAAGTYIMAEPGSMDGFLESILPRWRRDGWRVELDAGLRSLLEGRHQLDSRITLKPALNDDDVECTWTLEAGGHPLSSADIRRLRLFPGRFFRLENGRVVSVQRGVLKRQIEELVQIGYSPLQPGPQMVKKHFVPRAAALAGGATTVRLTTGLEKLRHQLENVAADEVAPPGTLAGILRDYQKEGLQFLHFLSRHGFGGVLADDMGLGKTVQTLALLELHRQRHGTQASLVVCPTSVAPNWMEECKRFTPALKPVYLSSSRDLESCDPRWWDLVIVSYGLIQKNRIGFPFRFLVLDEAQQIKNPQAKRTRAVKAISARHRLALTGTPIENSLAELWSLFDFLMPGFLGGQTYFERRYRRPLERDPDDERTMRELAGKVRPFILRRMKSEVASELPPKSEQDIRCEMTPRQKRFYKEIVQAMRGRIDLEIQRQGWEKSRMNILAALLRLRQACCHPGLIGPEFRGFGSGKLEAFLELTEAVVAAGSRIVVFSQFVRMLKILAAALHKRGVPWLYLDGSSRDRHKVVQRFQHEGSHPVFLMSLKAGGTGLNLTAADYVLLYDPWWNPAVENQAIDRIHRIGQCKPVTAYRLITIGTIEEKMLELKKRKQDLADRLLDGEGPDFRSLTPEDLEMLLGGDG